jgi:CDP-glucose 4,6-dehydratase
MENMEVNKNFWLNKKVFITGHTGFKGSWLALWLNSLGAKITGFSLAPDKFPNLYELTQIDNCINSIIGDIKDSSEIHNALLENQPDVIFHLAAQSIVRKSFQIPIETYATNIMGTVNLLEASSKLKNLKSIIVVTSDKCYQNHEWDWSYRENDMLGGKDPYSSSKACVELISNSFRECFLKDKGIFLATTRAGNVVGGGDWSEDRLIPDILKNIENNNTIKIRNPNSIRPWQHVLEPLSGYITLAEKLYIDGNNYSQAWNFGPKEDDAKSVKWIVENIIKKFEQKIKWENEEFKNNEQQEAKILKLDSSKSRNLLGWHPLWNIDYALDKTLEWNKAYLDNEDMKLFTMKQINEYNLMKNDLKYE